MENKYFTPNIEDIRIGYEFEWKKVPTEDFSWEKDIMNGSKLIAFLTWGISPDRIRVPYLTKEQIEVEGWEFPTFTVTSDTNDVWGTIVPLIKITNGDVIYCRQFGPYIKISQYGGGILFMGECKDINTFRYICKLLKVN